MSDPLQGSRSHKNLLIDRNLKLDIFNTSFFSFLQDFFVFMHPPLVVAMYATYCYQGTVSGVRLLS